MSDTRTGSVTNFDAWKHAYAARAANLSVSEVRALFAVVSRPEVVSLAGGMPDVSALDGELIEQAFRSLMSNRRNYALQYGGGQGDLRLREQIQEIMALDGVHGSVEDLMITTGSQHGLELLADLFLDQGDVVLVEAPSYVGAVGIFRHKEAHIEHVFTDEDGISPEALAEAADRLIEQGRKVKLLYLVPNFANPSGVTLTAERRAQVLQVCRDRGILIIEDNPYGLLYFDQKVWFT
jgi:DNA-binding transcriptional MocR family regulator